MRLLDTVNFEMKEFTDDKVPPYAILSHTWDEKEVTFQDMIKGQAQGKEGYEKVENFCSVAARECKHVWVDACCIDKTSSVELSEAINSMYRWYQRAQVCYAYLAEMTSSVSDRPARRRAQLSKCKWFTRGWTLQELLAPANVVFLNQAWEVIGDKFCLRHDISEITRIPIEILEHGDFESVCIAQRMSWAAKRKTSRLEDRAYSLMGIFGINMPLLYGEGEMAFVRLQEEIIKVTDDHSIFAWKCSDQSHGGLLATSPDAFEESEDVVVIPKPLLAFSEPLTVSNKGIHLELRFGGTDHSGIGLATLHCTKKGKFGSLIAIYLEDISLKMERFKRVRCEKFELVSKTTFGVLQYSTRSIFVRQRHLASAAKDPPKPNWESFDMMLMNAMSFAPPRDDKDILRDEDGRTPLSHAAGSGHLEKVWLLLARGDVEADLEDDYGRTPLSHAAGGGHKAVVWLLLTRRDVRPYSQDQRGWTPLSHAAREGHREVIEMFLFRRDFKDHLSDGKGRTPLSHAAEGGQDKMVKMFLTRNDIIEPNFKDDRGWTPLSYAAEKGHEAIVKLLLEYRADANSKSSLEHRTPLSYAAENGHEAVAKLLLQYRADAKSKSSERRTPLSYAAEKGHEKVVELLVKEDADINAQDGEYRNTLHAASHRGYEKIVELLIKGGADVNAQGEHCAPPLGTALRYASAEGHEKVVKLLIKGGADVNARGGYDNTVLHVASHGGHEKVVELLVKGGADANAEGRPFGTALQVASYKGHEKVVGLLVKRGANVNAQGGRFNTALQAASYGGHWKIVKLLVKEGADVNAQGGECGTALLAASAKGYEKIVELLVKEGADVNARLGHSGTPVEIALNRGHTKVVELLKAAVPVGTKFKL